MQLAHVEAEMKALLDAVSGLTLDDVLTVETALRANWLTDAERQRLKPLADSFGRLSRMGTENVPPGAPPVVIGLNWHEEL